MTAHGQELEPPRSGAASAGSGGRSPRRRRGARATAGSSGAFGDPPDVLDTFDRVQTMVDRMYPDATPTAEGHEQLDALVRAQVAYARRLALLDIAQRSANVVVTCTGAAGIGLGIAAAGRGAGFW